MVPTDLPRIGILGQDGIDRANGAFRRSAAKQLVTLSTDGRGIEELPRRGVDENYRKIVPDQDDPRLKLLGEAVPALTAEARVPCAPISVFGLAHGR